MPQRNNGDSRGRFVLLLTALLVGLRLGGVTDWQWYWVFALQRGNLVMAIILGEDEGPSGSSPRSRET
jgi:hypothetical protein